MYALSILEVYFQSFKVYFQSNFNQPLKVYFKYTLKAYMCDILHNLIIIEAFMAESHNSSQIRSLT